MNVLENNVPLGGHRGIVLSAPANWTSIRNNRLEVLDSDEPPIEYYGREQMQDSLQGRAALEQVFWTNACAAYSLANQRSDVRIPS